MSGPIVIEGAGPDPAALVGAAAETLRQARALYAQQYAADPEDPAPLTALVAIANALAALGPSRPKESA